MTTPVTAVRRKSVTSVKVRQLRIVCTKCGCFETFTINVKERIPQRIIDLNSGVGDLRREPTCENECVCHLMSRTIHWFNVTVGTPYLKAVYNRAD